MPPVFLACVATSEGLALLLYLPVWLPGGEPPGQRAAGSLGQTAGETFLLDSGAHLCFSPLPRLAAAFSAQTCFSDASLSHGAPQHHGPSCARSSRSELWDL